MSNNQCPNEAEFESNVISVLRKLFPSLAKITLRVQRNLKITLGHTAVRLDGKVIQSINGIWDVLVLFDETPALLVENKKPGTKLTTKDRDQAFSYARLITPMPPLFVLTNGKETEIYRTYDKSVWSPENLTEESFNALLQEGLQIADTELDDAVANLLGNQPTIWKSVFDTFTCDALKDLEGNLDDVTRPVVRDFVIPRRASIEVTKKITSGKKLIALVGPPLGGKTNAMAQVAKNCSEQGVATLFMSIADASVGILETITQLLNDKLFLTKSNEEIRTWLRQAFNANLPSSLVLLLDGWNAVDGESAKNSLHETLRLCTDIGLGVVIAIDDSTWQKIAFQPGRQEYTRIGRKADVITLEEIEECELLGVEEAALHQGMRFLDGWRENPDYRYPRILRATLAMTVTSLPKPSLKLSNLKDTSHVHVIPPITGIELLARIRARLSESVSLTCTYKEYAALCVDESMYALSPELSLFQYRRASVRLTTARDKLGSSLDKMVKEGHLRIADSPKEPVVIATLPEFVSVASISIIVDRIIQLCAGDKITVAVEHLIRYASHLPSGEVVIALCLMEMDTIHLTRILTELVDRTPIQAKLPIGSEILAQLGDVQLSTVIKEGETDMGLITENVWPALVLSHLVGRFTSEQESNEEDLNLLIWRNLGSFPAPIISTSGNSSRVLHVHDLPDGSCLCCKQGIIEPITWSMETAFHSNVSDMQTLANHAVAEKHVFLALRLHHAATIASTAVCTNTAARAQAVIEVTSDFLNKYLGLQFQSITGHDGECGVGE